MSHLDLIDAEVELHDADELLPQLGPFQKWGPFTLSILGLSLYPLGAIAFVLAAMHLSRMNRGTLSKSGRAVSIVTLILGGIEAVLTCVILVVATYAMVFVYGYRPLPAQ